MDDTRNILGTEISIAKYSGPFSINASYPINSDPMVVAACFNAKGKMITKPLAFQWIYIGDMHEYDEILKQSSIVEEGTSEFRVQAMFNDIKANGWNVGLFPPVVEIDETDPTRPVIKKYDKTVYCHYH